MSIHFHCPVCRAVFQVSDNDAGKKTDCTKCGQRLQVPEPTGKPALTARVHVSARNAGQSENGPTTPVPAPQIPVETHNRTARSLILTLIVLGSAALTVVLITLPKHSGRNRITERIEIEDPKALASTVQKKPPEVQKEPPDVERNRPSDETQKRPGRQELRGEEIYRKLVRSTVLIVRADVTVGIGTGFLVDRKNRLIVTNSHVVNDNTVVHLVFPKFDSNQEVIADAKSYGLHDRTISNPATVLYSEPEKDLALIQAGSLSEICEEVTLAERPAVTGSDLYSIGNSGFNHNLLWRFTKGSSRGRTERRIRVDGQQIDCMILESDSPTNPGDSGGPVVDDSGRVVGVTAHIMLNQRQVSGSIDLTELVEFLARADRRPVQKTRFPAEPHQPRESLPDMPKAGFREPAPLSVEKLIEMLTTGSSAERKTALVQLGILGKKAARAAEFICNATCDTSNEIATLAVRTLERVAPELYPPVADISFHRNHDLKLNGIRELGEMGPRAKPAVNLLVIILNNLLNPDSSVKIEILSKSKAEVCYRAIVNIDPVNQRIFELLAMMADPKNATFEGRSFALRELESFAGSDEGQIRRVVPLVIPYLDQTLLRKRAIEVLVKYKALSASAIPKLRVVRMFGPDLETRTKAANAILAIEAAINGK
jgi:S1-C subfamily serine protease